MDIYYPSSLFIRNKYFSWYRSIVEGSAERNKHEKYTENHHILPKSLFPEYSDLRKHKWNSAKLTYREHFLVHWLLTKIVREKTPEWYMMLSSLICMQRKSKNQKRIVSSWQYEICKKANTNSDVKKKSWETRRKNGNDKSNPFSFIKGWETRRANGNDKPSTESNIKRSLSQKGKPKQTPDSIARMLASRAANKASRNLLYDQQSHT